MSFKVKRINQEDVKPVKFIDEEEDKRPIAGADIFPEIYANVFFCARKKSGKTCAIYHTIKNCATRETRVIAFVSTLHRDPTWRSIKHLCEKMEVDFTGYTSIRDPATKEDILDTIVKTLENEEPPEEEEAQKVQKGKGKRKAPPLIDPPIDDALIRWELPMTSLEQLGGGTAGDNDEKKEKKRKPPKFRAPKYIFCFDDLSTELQYPSVTALMKKNRQFKSKLLIASQNFNDLALQARKQLDYFLAWKGLGNSMQKLDEIYRNLDLSVSFPVFVGLYRFATKEKYCWLYVDVVNSEFRKNFSHALEIPKEEEETQPVVEI